MDISKIGLEKYYDYIYIKENHLSDPDIAAMNDKIINQNFYFINKFKKIDFNKPLFKGNDISQNCNPVSCRLFIFFTDFLIPFFIKNINGPEINIVIKNFTAIFNCIFYLIFDNYEINEKKWIVNQIDKILKGLDEEIITDFKNKICISFKEPPIIKKIPSTDPPECNFSMYIVNEDLIDDYLSDEDKKMIYEDKKLIDDFNKDNNILFNELANISKHCFPFLNFYQVSTHNNFYLQILFKPIIIKPTLKVLFPIKKDEGITIFTLFTDNEILLNIMQTDLNISDLKKRIDSFIIEKNVEYNIQMLDDVKNKIIKIIYCFYYFFYFQKQLIISKEKKYPETYEETFTIKYNVYTSQLEDFINLMISKKIEGFSDDSVPVFTPIEKRRQRSKRINTSPHHTSQPKPSIGLIEKCIISTTNEITVQNASPQEEHKIIEFKKNHVKNLEKDNEKAFELLKYLNRHRTIPPGWVIRFDKQFVRYYLNINTGQIVYHTPSSNLQVLDSKGGSYFTKKTSIKKKILKKPKKTIRNKNI